MLMDGKSPLGIKPSHAGSLNSGDTAVTVYTSKAPHAGLLPMPEQQVMAGVTYDHHQDCNHQHQAAPPRAPASSGCWQLLRRKIRANSCASLLVREM